jgi:sugar lactone lactonase YvrE
MDDDLNWPSGLAVDGAPSLYIADASHRRILRAQPDKLTVIAGNGEVGGDGDGGPATKARFFHPQGVALDQSGRVLVADVSGHRLRVIGTDGMIDGLAGSGRPGFQGDAGPARGALLSAPQSLVADEQGNVYFVDAGNRRVRKIGPDGKIVTIAGADTLATVDLQLLAPTGAAVGPSGDVYIADTLNHRAVRIAADGATSVVAGNGSAAFTFDGSDGIRMLNEPVEIAVFEGSVLIADSVNHRIKRVASDGRVSVVAGVGWNGMPTGDGGPATEARLNMPAGFAVDPRGGGYISERWTHRIRQVRPDGTITTVAGTGEGGYSGDGGPATQARIQGPCGLAMGPDGSLYFADRGNNRVRRITPQGTMETVAGKGQAGHSGDGGPAREALLNNPHGVAFDQKGNLYISEPGSHYVRLVTPDGTIYTVAGALRGVPGVRFQGDGGPATEAQLFQPHGIAVDQDGNVYIADRGNNRIRKLTRVPD